MNSKLFGLLALLAASAASAQAFDYTTFDVNFTAGGGEQITGNLVYNGNQLTSWALQSVSPAAPFSYSSVEGGFGSEGPGAVLSIANGDLIFAPASDEYSEVYFDQYLGYNSLSNSIKLIGSYGGPSCNNCVITPGGAFSLAPGTILGIDPPSTGAMAAPEIDPAGTFAGLTLLLGALAVARGRRRA